MKDSIKNRNIVIIGAGGHAKVAIEAFRYSGWTVVGCTDQAPSSNTVLGVPVIGDDTVLPGVRASGVKHAFVALGLNVLREQKSKELAAMGFKLANCVGPQAVVSPSAKIGDGVAIFAGAVINACARVGAYSIINTNASIDHDCSIGIAAHIAPGCSLAGGIKIGDRSFLGIGTSVIPNIIIGKDCVIAAGSVVIRDVPDNSRIMGVPARPKS